MNDCYFFFIFREYLAGEGLWPIKPLACATGDTMTLCRGKAVPDNNVVKRKSPALKTPDINFSGVHVLLRAVSNSQD